MQAINPVAAAPEVFKAQGKRPASSRVQALQQIFASADLRKQFPWLGLSAFLSNILGLALPLTILQILDRVVVNQSIQTLVLLVIGVLIALFLEVLMQEASGWTTGWLGARFELQASVNAVKHLVNVPLERYEKDEPGTHAERVLASGKVADFYSGSALLVLFDFPFAIMYWILIIIIAGWLVLVPIFMAMVFFGIILNAGSWMQRQVAERDIHDDRRLGFLTEVLTGIHSVKTQMLESLLLRRHECLQQANSELSETLAKGEANNNNLSNIVGQLLIISVVFFGSMSVMSGGMTPGGLAACMLLSVRSLQPMRRGLAVWIRYQTFVAANDRLNALMKIPRQSDAGKQEIGPIVKSLELRDVTVSFDIPYHEPRTVFSNLNLFIKAGDCIAIRGDSGSGKTSVLALMNGMLRPTRGSVLVDEQALESYVSDGVYKQIALLPQTGSIVNGTILQNLTMFDDKLNHDALQIASRLGLDRFVATMKMGYETSLGEGNGATMPGGLRQIIIMARALVRKPSMILFDEANTSLDMLADQLLRNFLAELKGTCTIVLVTLRPSLLSLADKIYRLEDGVLSEVAITSNSHSFAPPVALKAVSERPEAVNDPGVVIQRQFKEESDFSICLQPLLQAFKWHGPARELAEAMPHLLKKLDLSNLCSIMANLDLMPKHFPGNLAQLHPHLMPCLFVPKLQAAILVLEVLPEGKLRVFDTGCRSEISIKPQSIDGAVYLFKKLDAKVKVANAQKSWIGRLMWRLRSHIILVLLLSLTGALLSLATPMYVRFIYDSVLPSADIVMGAYVSLGVLTVLGVDYLLKNLKGRLLAFIAGRTEYVLGNDMFERIISLPSSFGHGASVSRQVARMRNLSHVRDFISGPLTMLVFEMPSSIVLLVALAFVNPYVLGVLFLSGITFSLLGFWTRKSNAFSTSTGPKLLSERWEFLNETLTDMRTIRMSGAAQIWVKRFYDLSGKAIMAGFLKRRKDARIGSISQVVGSVTGLLGLATSAYLAISGQISSGTLVATMLILWRVTGPMENIFMASTVLTQGLENIMQSDRLMRLKGESEIGVAQTLRGNAKGLLSFSRVSFRYQSDADPVLLGVTFEAKPGQLFVLTGDVGSGKSSILKLVERTFSPQAGTIRIDGVDIRQLTTSDLRTKLGYMPQHCELFYGTVAQNLLLIYPAASDEELQWAMDMSGLSVDIAALPEGSRTRISSSKSNQLPHGFRQRLSLARVMLKPAPIVLLDEPGAGMDMVGEEALLRCLQWLHGKSTVLMVSHRPGHMKLADTVIVLRQGVVEASGNFESVKDKIFKQVTQ